MESRGQVTLFLVFGIIVIIIAVILVSQPADREALIPREHGLSSIIMPFVEQCLESSLEDSVMYVSNHGGYYHLYFKPEAYEGRVPYYRVGENITVPSQEVMESELARYAEDAMWLCVDGSDALRLQGIDVDYTDLSVAVSIREKDVLARLTSHIKITRGKEQYMITGVTASVASQIKEMHDVSVLVARSPDALPLTRFDVMLREHGFSSDILMDGDSVVYTIKDGKVTYAFAARYGWNR